MQILSGHNSQQTAYVVNDYPYGFRLRCKIRYWLETNNKGSRFCSQTTNPKVPGEVWNKPKFGTYFMFGASMFLNEDGHVTYNGAHEYMSLEEAKAFLATYESGIPAEILPKLKKYISLKTIYEQNKAAGMNIFQAASKAVLEVNEHLLINK